MSSSKMCNSLKHIIEQDNFTSNTCHQDGRIGIF